MVHGVVVVLHLPTVQVSTPTGPTGWPVRPSETVRVTVTLYDPVNCGAGAAAAMPPAKASVPAVAPANAVRRVRLRMNFPPRRRRRGSGPTRPFFFPLVVFLRGD